MLWFFFVAFQNGMLFLKPLPSIDQPILAGLFEKADVL
jgi:hypothetical protein